MRRRSKQHRVFLALSDMHAGHRLGLLNPNTVLVREDDLGQVHYWTPALGATQEWLWECYQDDLAQVAELAGGGDVVAVHLGDATQGDHWGGCIPDTTRDDQRVIAAANLKPLVDMSRSVRLVTGTAVHIPDCAEARIAAELDDRVKAAHHTRVTVDGVVFDLAHHGPHPGSRDWLRGNTALYYLKSAVYTDRRLGKEPARVYLRGHFHDYVPSTFSDLWHGAYCDYTLAIVPSFCGFTDYARKVTRSSPALTVGMVAFVVQDGQLIGTHPFTHSLDLRVEETL